MTREDAKIFLYSVAGDLGFINVENYTCQDGEKMREAIKALEEPRDVFDEYGNYKYPSDVELTEPNTTTSMPCDNAISRQAAVEAFQMFRGYEANRTNAEWVDRIETVVKKLPPVTPQQKMGQNFINWISIDEEPPKSHQQVWVWYKHYEKYKFVDWDKKDDHYTETTYETAKIDTYIIGEFGKTFWLNLPKDESYIGYHGEKHIITNTVLAWCPMEPYQHK